MRETAYAKINLALHVRERMPDGYHRLETVFAFAQDGDGLEVVAPERAGALELAVIGPFASDLGDPNGNLVMRAAQSLREHYRAANGARLILDKQLPIASGIGGGSADAAAALRLLLRWWRLPHEPHVLHEIARALGADVPACIDSQMVRGRGRGDELEPVHGNALSGAPLLLVNPLVPVPTGPVFAAWDGIDRGPLGEDLIGRNDLEAPARAVAPAIADVLAQLAGASHWAMSGSGATCFAIYGDIAERDMAAAGIRAQRPGWWLLPTRLR